MRFVTYELLISLIFQFFSGCGKLRINETTDTESMDMGGKTVFTSLCFKLWRKCTGDVQIVASTGMGNGRIQHNALSMTRTCYMSVQLRMHYAVKNQCEKYETGNYIFTEDVSHLGCDAMLSDEQLPSSH
jgi:hypothetical protein